MTRQDLHEKTQAWMQDGREDRVVAAVTPEWSKDPFLMLQYAVALARLDRLAEAKRAFDRAARLPAATDAQRAFAGSWLDWIEQEFETVGRARAALWRARLGIGAGLLVVAAVTSLGWVVARRARVEDPSKVGRDSRARRQ